MRFGKELFVTTFECEQLVHNVTSVRGLHLHFRPKDWNLYFRDTRKKTHSDLASKFIQPVFLDFSFSPLLFLDNSRTAPSQPQGPINP